MADEGSSRKLQLVAELSTKVKEIDAAFRGIESSSRSFANNIASAVKAMASGGGGGGSSRGTISGGFGSGTTGIAYDNATAYPSSMNNAKSTGTGVSPTQQVARMGFARAGGTTSPPVDMSATADANAPFPRDPRFSGGVAANMGRIAGSLFGSALGAVVGMGMMATPQISDALQLNMLANRQRFYGGASTLRGGFDIGANLSAQGTPISPMDAPVAANASVAYGMLPSNRGYSTFLSGAATFSNLYPGIGLQGGVQAMGALNQARNVNLLRMIGINVRNPQGTGMNSIDDIVNKLFGILKQASGGAISPQDIATSAMPGNALDSLLNQYFGNDENLKYGVLFALIQKARGGTFSKSSLESTGASTAAVGSVAGLNTTLLNSFQALSGTVLQGMIGANKMGTGLINAAKNAIGNNGALQGLVGTASFIDAFSGINQGAGGMFLGSVTNAARTVTGGLAGALGASPLVSGLAGAIGGTALNVGLAGLNGGLTPVGPYGEPRAFARSNANNASNSGLTVNVYMNGSYDTGTETGQAIARSINKELIALAAART